MSTKLQKRPLGDKLALEIALKNQGFIQLAKVVSTPSLTHRLERILDKLPLSELESSPQKLLLIHSDLDCHLLQILNDHSVLRYLDEVLAEPKMYYDSVKDLQSGMNVEHYSENLIYSAEIIRSLLLSIYESQIKGGG